MDIFLKDYGTGTAYILFTSIEYSFIFN